MEMMKMNETKMLELADFMENLESDRFHMGHWMSYIDYDENNVPLYEMNSTLDIHDCNTAGCIAGWVLALQNNGIVDVDTGYNFDDDYQDNIKINAASALQLSEKEADRLFLFGSDSVWFEHREDYGFTQHYNEGNLDGLERPYAISEEEITAKHVADMLRRIVKGEVVL
jgi:hypothetical protein